jgi:hypothetical protein
MSPEKKDAFILISSHEQCEVRQNKENNMVYLPMLLLKLAILLLPLMLLKL